MKRELRFTLLVAAATGALMSAAVQSQSGELRFASAASLAASDDRAEAGVPAYVPLNNLGAFLTAAWQSARDLAPKVRPVEPAQAAVPDNSKSKRSLASIEKVVQTVPTMVNASASPTITATPAVVSLPAAQPDIKVTAISVQSDDAPIKQAKASPVETTGSIEPVSAKADAVAHVLPTAVIESVEASRAKVSAKSAPSRRVASLSKTKAAKGRYRDWQVGVVGQSMEPLINRCAQAPKRCPDGDLICGC